MPRPSGEGGEVLDGQGGKLGAPEITRRAVVLVALCLLAPAFGAGVAQARPVGIVDYSDDAHAEADLAAYCSAYGRPAFTAANGSCERSTRTARARHCRSPTRNGRLR